MAITNFDVGDPLCVKLFSASLQKALPKQSWFMSSGFMGADPTQNVIVVKGDLVGKYGDQISFAILQQLRGYSTPGAQQQKGREKKLVYLDDRMAINQQRTGVNCGGTISNKRVPYDTRKDAKNSQADFWGVRVDEEIIAKLTGAMGAGAWETIDPDASGFDVLGAVDSDGNLLRAPSSNRLVWAGASASKVALLATDIFTLDLVDTALRKVTRLQTNGTTKRKMAPLRINGKNLWICLLDLTHAFDLKKNSAGRWYDIEKARLTGGMKDSGLVQQSLGIYESAAGAVAFFSHEGMVKFNDGGAGANVEYAASLLMGQCAGVFAPGEAMGQDGVYTKWHEETDNRGDEVIITSGMIYGFQKTSFRTDLGVADTSREDFGCCVMYAAAAWST
jgi:N4-gp56 family major capsid protein